MTTSEPPATHPTTRAVSEPNPVFRTTTTTSISMHDAHDTTTRHAAHEDETTQEHCPRRASETPTGTSTGASPGPALWGDSA
jgi:hypothetical protein